MGVIRMFAAATVGLVSTVAMAADPDQAIRQSLQKIQPDMPIEAVAESPMPGVYQVQLEGGRQLYASADGQFVIQGYLYQFKDGQAVNLTEQAQSRSVAKQINAIPASEMVVFAPKAPKTHITVFTDTDCGYCQKLHSEVPELNRRGIEVRYVAFPRQGLGNAAIAAVASDEQKERYAGKWAAMAITEPDVGSDSGAIRTTAVKDGDEYVLNGEKYYISGAGDPRCKIMIVMCQTDPDAPPHRWRLAR